MSDELNPYEVPEPVSEREPAGQQVADPFGAASTVCLAIGWIAAGLVKEMGPAHQTETAMVGVASCVVGMVLGLKTTRSRGWMFGIAHALPLLWMYFVV